MKKAIFTLVFLVIIAALLMLSFSQKFEKDPPKISLDSTIYWNLKTPINVLVSDSGAGVATVKIELNDGERSYELLNQKLNTPQRDFSAQISWPKGVLFDNKKSYTLSVKATDNTLWRLFEDNLATASSQLIIDTKPPQINIIANSRYITKGGSAAVVFSTNEPNLKEIFIRTKTGKVFRPVSFIKPNQFASLIAWDIKDDNFAAEVIATDAAGNEAKSKIPLYLQKKQYKISKIELKEQFLNGKIAELEAIYAPQPNNFSALDRFKFVNEDLRDSNEKIITEITSNLPESEIAGFFIEPFYPLKNGAAVGSFGDHRYFTHAGKTISESWHLGIDLASTAKAQMIASNAATVAYAEQNGIYGQNLILYHGFGLYTLYGHCDSISVATGDNIAKNDPIARTGTTGLALGDHLHFSVFIQGVSVRPEEWMDKKWMSENVFKILAAGK